MRTKHVLYCFACDDFVAVRGEARSCHCGSSSAQLHADGKPRFSGPCTFALIDIDKFRQTAQAASATTAITYPGFVSVFPSEHAKCTK